MGPRPKMHAYRLKSTSLCLGVLASAIAVNQVAPAQEIGTQFQPGLYEIEVELKLPNLEGASAKRQLKHCLVSKQTSQDFGLKVLSLNNPLSKCSHSKITNQSKQLRFHIKCPGVNGAKGFATFNLQTSSFSGHIKMQMGGKNMTMSEWQNGRRIGECD